MRFLPPEDAAIVHRAQGLHVPGAFPAPTYLCPKWCIALSLLLALPTLGHSFVLVPILWVIQHDRTASRLTRLRREVNRIQWQKEMGSKQTMKDAFSADSASASA